MTIDSRNWMGNLSAIDARPLKDIVVPGSHDAGTYVMYSSADNKSSQCQRVNIVEQLRAGSRYLDLRAWKSGGTYWMYHGLAWTSVKLEDVLKQILTFLNESPKEIVIATLLIKDGGNWDEDGWAWACGEVNAQLASRAPTPSFAKATPNDLRESKRRLVLLKHEEAPGQGDFADIDRDGVYAGTRSPQDTLEKLRAFRVPNNKMWILHMGLPFLGSEIAAAILSGGLSYLVGVSLEDKAKLAAEFFHPRFMRWQTRRLNVINVDFVDEFGWVEAIVKLNETYPKTWPLYFGGEGGEPFADPEDLLDCGPITRIEVQHGVWIDALRFTYDNSAGRWHGGTGGTRDSYEVPKGHKIVRVEGSSGQLIDRLQFFTDKGDQSQIFGGAGGEPFEIRADQIIPGSGLITVTGRAGPYVEGLTFHCDTGHGRWKWAIGEEGRAMAD